MLKDEKSEITTLKSEAVEKRVTIKELSDEELDYLPTQLTRTELEALMVLLDNKTPMTTKAIEKQIQWAHIISAMEKFRQREDIKSAEINLPTNPSKRIAEFSERYHTNVRMFFQTARKLTKSKKLPEALAINSLELLATQWYSLKEGISNAKSLSYQLTSTYGNSDNPSLQKLSGKVSLEGLRIAWVSAINSLFHYDIPSGKKIESALDRLRTQIRCITKEKMNISTKSTSAWVLDTTFLQFWNKRRAKILGEVETQFDKERAIGREGVRKGFSVDESDIEGATMRFIIAKYTPLVLDFYLFPETESMEDRHEILSVRYAKEVKQLI